MDTTVDVDLSIVHSIIFYINGYSSDSPYLYYNFYIGDTLVLYYGSHNTYVNKYYHAYTIIDNNICRLYAPTSQPPSTAYYTNTSYISNLNSVRVSVSGQGSVYYNIKIYVA